MEKPGGAASASAGLGGSRLSVVPSFLSPLSRGALFSLPAPRVAGPERGVSGDAARISRRSEAAAQQSQLRRLSLPLPGARSLSRGNKHRYSLHIRPVVARNYRSKTAATGAATGAVQSQAEEPDQRVFQFFNVWTCKNCVYEEADRSLTIL